MLAVASDAAVPGGMEDLVALFVSADRARRLEVRVLEAFTCAGLAADGKCE